MSDQPDYDALMAMTETFEYQLGLHTEMLAHRAMPEETVKNWLLAQEWPEFDPGCQEALLAAACWWFLTVRKVGHEDSYQRHYYHLIGKLRYGLAIPEGGMDVPVDHLKSRYDDLRKRARAAAIAA